MNDGADAYSASDVTCDDSSTLSYQDCLHGGEMRKVVVTGVSSCTGLSLSDSWGAFHWTCLVKNGVATFFSTGLNDDKGLRDLISGLSWTQGHVTLSGARTGSSGDSSWWSNSIVALPDNHLATDGMVTLDNGTYPQRTILVAGSSRATGGYEIQGDLLALVTLGSAKLTYNGNAASNCNGGDWCVILGTGKYPWIEGSFDGKASAGTDADFGFYLTGTNFARVNNSTVQNNSNINIRVILTSKASFTSVTIGGTPGANAGNSSIEMEGPSTHLYFENIRITQADNMGIWETPGNNNIFRRISVSNAGWGIFLDTETGDEFQDLYFNNLGSCGINMVNNSSGNTFRKIRASNSYAGVCFDNTANANQVFDVAAGNVNYGVIFNGTAFSNLVSQVAVTDAYNAAIGFENRGGPHGNFIVQALLQNTAWGIDVDGSNDNTFSQITTVNNAAAGIGFFNGSLRNTVNQLLAVNNVDGLVVEGGIARSTNNSFSQIASVDNSNSGIRLTSQADTSKFSGTLVVGESVDCNVQAGGTNAGLTDTTCNTDGVDGHSGYTGGFLSNAVLRTARASGSSFVGFVADAANSSADSTGAVGAFPAAPLTFDWTTFGNYFRLWGISGTNVFPHITQENTWTAGPARIWDWRLLAKGGSNPVAPFLNNSLDGVTDNGPFVAGAPCPSALGASTTDQNGHTYLLNAVEIVDPQATGYSASGNHNGLCESGESCLYAPNYGAYQGQGTLAICTRPGYTIYGYLSNGI